METRRPRPTAKDRTTALTILIVGLFVVAAAAYGLVNAGTSNDPVIADLGANETFEAGAASGLAKEITADGPIIFPDLLRTEQNDTVILTHTGNSIKNGWLAISGTYKEADKTCRVELNRSSKSLISSCTDGAIQPNDNRVTKFSTKVINGVVVIDLSQ